MFARACVCSWYYYLRSRETGGGEFKGLPHFGLGPSLGIISLCDDDDFFNEQRRCDDDDDANECENQERHAHFFYRKREKRRKDEDEKRVVFFVFVTCTTRFSHTKEGV